MLCAPVIEGLEGRMLMSASPWEGTWHVHGVQLVTNSQAPVAGDFGGQITSTLFKPQDLTFNITSVGTGIYEVKVTEPGGSVNLDIQMSVNPNDANTLGADTLNQADGANIQDRYLRLQMLDGNTLAVADSAIKFQPSNKLRLITGDIFGGIGARDGTPVTYARFPWTGTRSFNMLQTTGTGKTTGAAGHSKIDSLAGNVSIVPLANGAYWFDSPDGQAMIFAQSGPNLAYNLAGRSTDASTLKPYVRKTAIIMQGPDGRLFYVDAGASFNSIASTADRLGLLGKGQLTSDYFDFGYTDAVNYAPVLTSTPVMRLPQIKEDDQNGSAKLGMSIPALIDRPDANNITDINVGAKKGIALTGVNTACGKWQYSTDGGSTWKNVGAVSDTSALLLASDPQNLLRLLPRADFNGTVANAITFRAWDRTTRRNNARVDVSVNGGARPFSSATASASIRVKPVNDAPVVSAVTITLAGAAMNKSLGISFNTLATAIQAVTRYSDVDNTHDSLGFQITAMSGTLKKSGVSAGSGPVLLMPGEAIAWRPATNAKGRITALQVQIWDGKLASTAFVTVIIRVV